MAESLVDFREDFVIIFLENCEFVIVLFKCSLFLLIL